MWASFPHILEPTYERANIKMNTKLPSFALNFLIPYVILWDFLWQNRFSCLIRLIRVYFAKKMLGFQYSKTKITNLGFRFQLLDLKPILREIGLHNIKLLYYQMLR